MTLKVAVIRRETERAIQVIVAERPHKIWWVPRSIIQGGMYLAAGQRDLEIEVPEWFVKKSNEEVPSDITLLSEA